MVVNMSSDSYSQFQAPVVEDAQSSEDGSEIHSPVFAGDGYANADNCMFSRFCHDFLTDLPLLLIKSGIRMITLTCSNLLEC